MRRKLEINTSVDTDNNIDDKSKTDLDNEVIGPSIDKTDSISITKNKKGNFNFYVESAIFVKLIVF